MPYISQITIQTFNQPVEEKSSEFKKEDQTTSAEKDKEETD